MGEYRDAIVTFFDILGFKDIVLSESAPTIEKMLEALTRYSQVDKDTGALFDSLSIHFSDSVVRVFPLDSETNTQTPIGALFHELIALAHIQIACVQEGVLLRGGVTVGKVLAKKAQAFGPAFVRAYELESSVATHPRIVVDQALLVRFKNDKSMRKDTHTTEEEAEYIRDILRLDSDGVWFVDYLRAAVSELDDPDAYPLFLDAHKELVTKNLRKMNRFDKTTHKLNWLAQYHNKAVRRTEKRWVDADAGIDWSALMVDVPAAHLPEL